VKSTNFRNFMLRTSLFASAVASTATGAAFAQQATGPAAEGGDVVTVTGSLIARQDYVANSPIVTVDADDISATGTATIDTLLNNLPQFVPAFGQTSNNPSNGGQANVSLRGLGTNRSLVLMNGRRIVPSNSDGTVDINLIPAQLIGQVETITGGASATYGSDALAGVVNFKLRDVKGIEFSTQFGETDRSDGASQTLSLAAGGDFDEGRGSATFMMSYNNREAIFNGARPASAVSGASAASPLGNTIFDTNNLPSAGSVTGVVPGGVPGDTFGFNNNDTLFVYLNSRDFVSPGGITYDGFAQPGPFFSPNFQFNTGALNLNTLPQTRYNAFTHVDYEVNKFFKPYAEVLFTEYTSRSELAASPAAGAATGFRVPVSNPFITPELRTLLATRTNPLGSFLLDKRFTALGARVSEELYDAYQGTVGTTGELGVFDWTYDLSTSYGRVNRTTIQTGNVSRSAVQSLLNATDGGASLCAGGFDWFGETNLSQACKNYIGRTSKNLVVTEQRNANLTIQGGAFELPAGEVRFAAGVAYREDTYNRVPDGSLTAPITTQPCIATAAYAGTNLPSSACSGAATPGATGTALTNNPALTGNDIAGFNPSSAFGGAIYVNEYFAEVLVPIVKDLPLAKEVNLTLAGRVSDYSTVGDVSAYKADFDWTVVDGLRFRGGLQTAVRAPSVGELFAPQLLGFPNIGTPNTGAVSNFSGDPCDVRSKYRSTNGAGANLAATTNAQVRALCIAQGVSASVIDTYTFTNQQVPGISGGNPNLTEESADSWTVGAVWSPNFGNDWIDALTVSVDYYNIELTDAIATVSASLMLQQCYNSTGTTNPTYDPANGSCQLFTRNPLNGNILNAVSLNSNLASATTSGVDFQLDWSRDIGPGTLSLGWIGSWLESFQTQAVKGAQFIEFTGFISNTGTLGDTVGSARPEFKWLVTSDYQFGDFKVGARWQHIDEMTNFNAPADKIPAIGYLDLLGSWNVNDNLVLRVNVNNVLDELPPTYAPSVQGNTDPSTYDTLGRRYTIGLTARF
jgi:iron complex outermembrane recepter protein